jgi:predicted dithiol-disulfide oxidoreductase (DUF899 family)
MSRSGASDAMTTHEVVSKSEWVEAGKRFLAKEKKFTRMRDQLSAERRAPPWQRIDKDYDEYDKR